MDEADLRAVGVPLQGDVHRRQLATTNWTGAENVGNLTQRASNCDFAWSSAAHLLVRGTDQSQPLTAVVGLLPVALDVPSVCVDLARVR